MLMDSSGAGWNEQLVDAMFLPFEAQQIKGSTQSDQVTNYCVKPR